MSESFDVQGGFDDVYRIFLVDTPIGAYFEAWETPGSLCFKPFRPSTPGEAQEICLKSLFFHVFFMKNHCFRWLSMVFLLVFEWRRGVSERGGPGQGRDGACGHRDLAGGRHPHEAGPRDHEDQPPGSDICHYM